MIFNHLIRERCGWGMTSESYLGGGGVTSASHGQTYLEFLRLSVKRRVNTDVLEERRLVATAQLVDAASTVLLKGERHASVNGGTQRSVSGAPSGVLAGRLAVC